MSKHQHLTQTTKSLPPNAVAVGEVNPAERLEISVLLRRPPASGSADEHAQAAHELGAQLPAERQYLSRAEYAAQHGADAQDVAQLECFAQEHHLTVTEINRAARTVKLSGTVGDLTAAFQTNLKHYEVAGRRFRGRSGALAVPAELAEIVVGVFGFDNRPVVQDRNDQARAQTGTTVFTPPQIAQLYNFPAGLDGTGQCIAIIEVNDVDANGKAIGGGFAQSDLTAYFQQLKLPTPRVEIVSVDGGANLPGQSGTDGEVTLDLEVAGAIAPGALLAVYFAPNTSQGFVDAVHAAVYDDVRKPSVISLSWGSAEDAPYTDAQLLAGLSAALQDAAHLGVTVCCATGDVGSADVIPPTQADAPHVDFPASNPFALACGGTTLVGDGTTIQSETVWNEGFFGPAGGGGVSNQFDRPAYQSGVNVPLSPTGRKGRGTPDVAGHAAGYQIVYRGQPSTRNGTSAVAPLWAGLVALLNQRLAALGKPAAGFVNPLLYQTPASFHDITKGSNDIGNHLKKYSAGKGWDACTGLGSPDGTAVMQALGG
jgi:kumamolisin